jgi:hypothetical protein
MAEKEPTAPSPSLMSALRLHEPGGAAFERSLGEHGSGKIVLRIADE